MFMDCFSVSWLRASVVWGFPWWLSGKEFVCQCNRCRRCTIDPCVGKIPWGRKWQPTLVSLPGKSHRQRSLKGYSPWGHRQLDMTEWLRTHTCRWIRKIHSIFWTQKKKKRKKRFSTISCCFFFFLTRKTKRSQKAREASASSGETVSWTR